MTASAADEFRLEIRQPDVVRPSIDLGRREPDHVAAAVVGAEHEQAPRAGATVSHFAKGDLVDRWRHGRLHRVLAEAKLSRPLSYKLKYNIEPRTVEKIPSPMMAIFKTKSGAVTLPSFGSQIS